MARPLKPTKITIRPTNTLEPPGIKVWVYHRKAQVDLIFNNFPDVESCIDTAVTAWYHAMDDLKKKR